MRKRQATQANLLDPQSALTVYLDALLCEVGFADEEPSANTRQEAPAEVVPMPVAEAGAAPETVAAAPATPPQAVQRKSFAWAADRFQCLSFQVAGLTLAAPLEKLHGIVNWADTLTELPGYAPWFMGLLPNRGRNVQVVDTARIVMPDGRRPDTRDVRERVQFVILLDDGRWGLAVDKLSEMLTLEPDAVRWSSENGKRPWLAGTVIDQMCALLDLDKLSEQLEQTQK
jgi:purine-binding chemotaxis protein CheW